jgi:hypothetical protein
MPFKRNQPSNDDRNSKNDQHQPDWMSDTGRINHPTLKLPSQRFATLEDLTPAPDWVRQGGEFVRVPLKPDAGHNAAASWRLELRTASSSDAPLRLHIVDDVILGRRTSADVVLDGYGAAEKGVSRRHVLLRPTSNQLYLIELGSTNGTMLNGLPLGAGMARPLRNEDVITLGSLRLTVRLHSSQVNHQNISQVEMFWPEVLDRQNRVRNTGNLPTAKTPPIDDNQ